MELLHNMSYQLQIKESTKTGRSIRELVRERGWMTDAELDKALDTLAMTKGGIIK